MSAPLASGIPAADVPREIRQAVAAIRAAGARSVSLKPIALRLGLKRTTFLRRADLRLPLDPEYIGEGLAVLAELREQLAEIEAAAFAADGEHWNGARAGTAARAEASSASDLPDSAADTASTAQDGEDGEVAGSVGSAGRHDADSEVGTAGTAGTGGDADAEWERAAQEYAVEYEDAAAAGKPKGAAVDLDEVILAAIMPKIDPVAFYGPLKPIVNAATAHSEATKTGVAMQILAHVGTMLRPFYIDLGDEKLPLNPFLIQCAPSAIGRKGTSAKFADTIIAPGIAAHAECVARKIQLAAQDAARVAAAKAAAERAVTDAEAQIDWAMTVTEEAKVAAERKRDQAQAELDATQTRLNEWRKKLADTNLAPATLEKYARGVTNTEREEAALRAAVARAEADVARTAAAMADRPAAVAAANEARRQAVSALAGLNGSVAVNVEPWQRLYAELAKPPVILSGISSGEGVIFNIRDAREGREGKGDDPGVKQKRMLITLAEFGSVLALVRRPGSTLSPVIRNAYDCTPLETAAKVEPVRCAQPYITLSAAITPAELFGMLFDGRDTTANRPLYLYAVREKLVANPKATVGADRMAEEIAMNIHSLYDALQPTKPFLGTAIPFTPEAAALYEQEIYPELNAITGNSINASKLFGRLTTNARKIAGILSVIAGEPAVSVGAIKAAAAWVRHGAATVNALASTVDERLKSARAHKDADAVLKALGKLGPGVLVPQRDVRRAAHLTAEQMKAAIAPRYRRKIPSS